MIGHSMLRAGSNRNVGDRPFNARCDWIDLWFRVLSGYPLVLLLCMADHQLYDTERAVALNGRSPGAKLSLSFAEGGRYIHTDILIIRY